MADSADVDALREYATYFLGKYAERAREAPGSSYEFEVRFGRFAEKNGVRNFDTNVPEREFETALALARSAEWERVEELEVTQYKKGNRRVRIDAETGAIVENVLKKNLSERTAELPSFAHAFRFSLARETGTEEAPGDLAGWDKSRKSRTRFVIGAVALDFTRSKARFGKERQIEVELLLSGMPETEAGAIAESLVMMIGVIDAGTISGGMPV